VLILHGGRKVVMTKVLVYPTLGEKFGVALLF